MDEENKKHTLSFRKKVYLLGCLEKSGLIHSFAYLLDSKRSISIEN